MSFNEANGKKRRTISPSHSTSTKEPDRSPASAQPTVYPPRATVLQKRQPIPTSDKTPINGLPSSSRKYPRQPSPASSDEGHTHRSSTSHKASASSSSHRTRADESKLLREALQKKAREIITYVESEGCKGIALRLHILDMKTRLVELDRIKAEPIPSKSSVQALENMLRRAAEAVVLSLQSDGCADVDLRLMVLDLDTRLSEMDKEHQ